MIQSFFEHFTRAGTLYLPVYDTSSYQVVYSILDKRTVFGAKDIDVTTIQRAASKKPTEKFVPLKTCQVIQEIQERETG